MKPYKIGTFIELQDDSNTTKLGFITQINNESYTIELLDSDTITLPFKSASIVEPSSTTIKNQICKELNFFFGE